jgi:hypothetical protein
MTERHNRIMIYGPKSDGTYVVELKTAAGEALAISVPGGAAEAIKAPRPAGPTAGRGLSSALVSADTAHMTN